MKIDYFIYSVILLVLAYFLFKSMLKWEQFLASKNERSSIFIKSRKINNRIFLAFLIIVAVIFLLKSWVENE